MDYNAIVLDAKRRGLEYLEDTEGWKLSNKSNEQIQIESKPSKKYNCNVWRVKLYVDAPMKLCEETIGMVPGTRRMEWDADIREIKLLKAIDDKTTLFYVHTNSVGKGVISPREFVDVYRTEEVSPDSIISYGCSVDHPAMTTDDKYVRAFDGCWIFRMRKDPSNEGRTIVHTISEAEFRGWIPSALLNSTVPAVLIQSLGHWMEFLKKELTS